MTSIVKLSQSGRIACGSKIRAGCVKLESGEKMHRHSTENGKEILIVLEGIATVLIGENTVKVEKEESIFIPMQTEHEVRNDSDNLVRYVYVVGGK